MLHSKLEMVCSYYITEKLHGMHAARVIALVLVIQYDVI